MSILKSGKASMAHNVSPSPMQTKFAHQNFYIRFEKEVEGDPILLPAEPNQFSAVVDKVMVGSTVEMRRLADEATKVAYMPSESRRLQASLPKNHV